MIKAKTTYHDTENGLQYAKEPLDGTLTHKKIKGGYVAGYLVHDEHAESPRSWDNAGTMVCFSRYDLGDKHDYKQSDFNSWDELKKLLIKNGAHIVLPLRLYDHSGISISTSTEYPFNDRWDSSMVGFIFITKEAMKREGWNKKRATAYLQSEVEVYNQYLSGDVYSIYIEQYDTDKKQIRYDCVGGYFGHDYAKGQLVNDLKQIKAVL